MSGQTLTHKDLASALGVSETTVKSYRRKFPGCFPVASKGKPIRFRSEAGEVALRIRDLFSTGMSVEEVHDRLAEDFPWWKPKEQGESKREAPRAKADLPQNFASAVSNMARSMISLNQQQSSILAVLQRLEALLADGGALASPGESRPGSAGAQPPAAARGASGVSGAQALKETQREIAAINVRLHSLTQSLAEQKAEAAEERAALLSALEKMAGLAPAKSAAPSAQVIKFEPSGVKTANMAAAFAPEAVQPEFPRKILALPLVVRTEDGAYLSAGGRSIGRISLNDLKAILAQTYLPPEHFSISWEHGPEGWWIRFSQRAIPEPMESTSIGILVQEITSSKGVSVLEVFKYTYNGKDCPTIDLVRFVTGMGKD